MNSVHARQTIGRTVRLLLFLLPVGYVATILGVAVHEILGHGMSAMLLGGQFSGFVLKWDAMGWAYSSLPSTASQSHLIVCLISGVVATTAFGGILLCLVFFFRKRPIVQLALLVISFICLMDGIPYLLWNSYHPVPPGDIGKVILLSCGRQLPKASAIRWAFLALGILLFAVTTFYFCTSIFVRLEKVVLHGDQFTGKSRLLALFFFLALPGSLGWLTFDWNQLAPGIGLLPCVVGALSVVAMASLLFWYNPKSKHRDCVYSVSWRHILVSWSSLVATVIAMTLWFEKGVMWG